MTLGVRPEHISLTVERGARAVVSAIEYLGADSLVACRLGPSSIAARVPGSVGLQPGDVAWLTWVGGAQHLFEAGGARRTAPSPQQSATLVA
jgi:sn-glycerol 3-phosphate transport system ATP-binding protein